MGGAHHPGAHPAGGRARDRQQHEGILRGQAAKHLHRPIGVAGRHWNGCTAQEKRVVRVLLSTSLSRVCVCDLGVFSTHTHTHTRTHAHTHTHTHTHTRTLTLSRVSSLLFSYILSYLI